MREFLTPADWERIFGGKSDKKSDRKERQRDQRRPDPEDAAEIAERGVEGTIVPRAVLADLRGQVRREEEAPMTGRDMQFIALGVILSGPALVLVGVIGYLIGR